MNRRIADLQSSISRGYLRGIGPIQLAAAGRHFSQTDRQRRFGSSSSPRFDYRGAPSGDEPQAAIRVATAPGADFRRALGAAQTVREPIIHWLERSYPML